jgi:hypothetical protein
MLGRGLNGVPIMLRKLVIENQAMGSGGRVFWWMKSIFRRRRTFRKWREFVPDVASLGLVVGETETGASDCE